MNKIYINYNGEYKQLEDAICRFVNSVDTKDTIVYARVDKDLDSCTITGGNLFDMVYGIAHIIKHMSKKSGAPVSIIIKMIADCLEV